MPELLPHETNDQRLKTLELAVRSLANTQRLGLVVSLGMLGLTAYLAFRTPTPPSDVMLLGCYD